MTKSNDIKENFAAILRESLRARFGRIPSAAVVAREFNLRAYDTPPISQESARRWIRGVSLPEEQRLRVLVNWLNLDFNAALRPGRYVNGNGVRPAASNALNGNGHAPPAYAHSEAISAETSRNLAQLVSQLNAEQRLVLESFMRTAFKNPHPPL